jgi:Fe2+ transport system protein FeoA
MIHTYLTLSEAPLGRRFRIQHLHPTPEVSARLREMGFCENAVVRCIMKGDGNLICELYNSRIGLNSLLANAIVITADE